jgi:hypothetical protein
MLLRADLLDKFPMNSTHIKERANRYDADGDISGLIFIAWQKIESRLPKLTDWPHDKEYDSSWLAI